MVDPLAAALIAAGATAGLTTVSKTTEKVVEAAWDLGRKWLASYYRQHSADVQARAEENAAAFLAELAIRIDKLESSAGAFGDQLKDPDFAATMASAFRSSARTSSAEKKGVLAGLVVERLLAAPESRVSVATNIAVAAMPNITEADLLQLACITSIHTIRPTTALGPATYTAWWIKRLGPFKEIPPQSSHAALHLASCQLLHYTRDVKRALNTTLQLHAPLGWSIEQLPDEWQSWLAERWSATWENVFPTPAGMMIGAEVCERHGVGSHVTFPDS